MDEITIILTAYKRDYFNEQIDAILNQTIPVKSIYIWQNGNYIDIDKYRDLYNVKLIKSDENLKFHGRFAFAHIIQTKYVAIFDDDIIPGKNWLDNCLKLSQQHNCIVGANGRTLNRETQKWSAYDVIIPDNIKVDFVGHCWFFKKEWLKHMWQNEPMTYDNGEDMQFCMSAKIFGNIDTYVAKQVNIDDLADTRKNKYASDEHASYKLRGHNNIRDQIMQFYLNKF